MEEAEVQAQVQVPAEAELEVELEEGEIPRAPKHRLEHSWTLSFDISTSTAKSKQKNWGSSLRHIYTFSTIEDFWRSARNKKLSPFYVSSFAVHVLRPSHLCLFSFACIQFSTIEILLRIEIALTLLFLPYV
jgi:hypothetical protein